MPTLDQPDIDIGDVVYPEPADLNLRVIGVANRRGTIIVLVFDDARAFAAYDHTEAVGYAEAAASMGAIEMKVPVFGEGPYAIFSYHDANGDAQLNMRGARPLEGYGYSGGIDPYAPPSFEQAAIVSGNATIRLVYLPKSSR
jgi:uncharacterized protein (DUF2141 family)